jgi:hypothetical protein
VLTDKIDKTLQSAATMSGLGVSFIDQQFALFYQGQSFPYTSVTRATGSPFSPNTQTPLLTLDGYIALLALNILCDPSAQHTGFQNFLAHTTLRNPTDDRTPLPSMIPRSAFPDAPDPDAVRRKEGVGAGANPVRADPRVANGQEALLYAQTAWTTAVMGNI